MTALTEKQVKELAIICDHACPGKSSRDFWRWADMVSNMADFISITNPTFNRSAFFFIACGYQRREEKNGFYSHPSRARIENGEVKEWTTL